MPTLLRLKLRLASNFPWPGRRMRAVNCFFLALACCSLVSAQEDERAWSFGLALGHGERSNPLINGEAININAVLDLSWYGERFFFDNGDFGFTLYEQPSYSFNLVTTVNNERNYYNYLTGRTFGLESLLNERTGTSNDDPSGGADGAGLAETVADPSGISIPTGYDAVSLNLDTDLPDRHLALNGGLEFLYISPWGDVQAQVLSDISSTHNGQEAWLSWSRPWYIGNNEFTLTLGMEWKSADLVSYYYGVREDEAFPGRSFYNGDAGTNNFIRFAARHSFSPHWHLVGMVEREFLSSAISNSPIVDGSQVDTFFAGLFYQF